jgi:hypothetical protein
MYRRNLLQRFMTFFRRGYSSTMYRIVDCFSVLFA